MSILKYYEDDAWNSVDNKVVADTLPIGTEVEYNGTSVPSGWEQIDKIPKFYHSNNSEDATSITLGVDYDAYCIVTGQVANWGYAGGTWSATISCSAGTPEAHLAEMVGYGAGSDGVYETIMCKGVYQLNAGDSFTFNISVSNGGTTPKESMMAIVIPVN